MFVALFCLGRGAAATALLGGVALTLGSFANGHTHDARTSIFYGFGRMYLAVPVMFLWVLVASGRHRERPKALVRWMSYSVLAAALLWGGAATWRRQQTLDDQVTQAVRNVALVQLVRVDDARAFAALIQNAADQQHASLVLLPNERYKHWDYLLPVLTTCETLLPNYERRTWRLYEECSPRYDRILIVDAGVFTSAQQRGFQNGEVVSQQPFIGAFDTEGESVIAICRQLNLNIRSFDQPSSKARTKM